MSTQTNPRTPRGFLAVGIFWFFGATMAGLAGLTLAWPGTFLDVLWSLNPGAHSQMAPYGRVIGIGFLFLAAILLATGVGWFRRRKWGWGLAVGIIAAQVIGDAANLLRGDYLRGATGLLIASALLVYLLRPAARRVFEQNPP